MSLADFGEAVGKEMKEAFPYPEAKTPAKAAEEEEITEKDLEVLKLTPEEEEAMKSLIKAGIKNVHQLAEWVGARVKEWREARAKKQLEKVTEVEKPKEEVKLVAAPENEYIRIMEVKD